MFSTEKDTFAPTTGFPLSSVTVTRKGTVSPYRWVRLSYTTPSRWSRSKGSTPG